MFSAIIQNQPPVTPMSPYMNQVAVGHPSNMGPLPGGPSNHFFMYQQSMSTSSPHQPSVSPMPFNPFTQQYLVPAVYNPQMMPYFYQQQQLIMSSNGMPPPVRALPFDVSNSTQINNSPSVSRPSDLLSSVIKEKDAEKEVEKDNGKEELQEDTRNEIVTSHSDEENSREPIQTSMSPSKVENEQLLHEDGNLKLQYF